MHYSSKESIVRQILIGLGIIVGLTFISAQAASNELSSLARQAISEDAAESATALAALRDKGLAGLDALLETHASSIQRHHLNGTARQEDPNWARLSAAVDTVARQRDAHVSGLYWHTDLEQAKTAARFSGRPILSLRLMGTLDTEFSCANSRFFRAILYANREVSAMLRDQFVLHWQSVRPVPKITIDFGDGRILHRTITGNSIHYILNSDGRPIDAIPGLYGPTAFMRQLQTAREASRQTELFATAAEIDTFLLSYHQGRRRAIATAWAADLNQLGNPAPGNLMPLADDRGNPNPPTALQAAYLTAAKSGIEAPILRVALPDSKQLQDATNDDTWSKIAAIHADEARIDNNSRQLIRRDYPTADEAGKQAKTKQIQENPLLRIVRNLEQSIALDTVKNEYLLHATLHEWFINGTAPANLDALNEKVYAELFLTPSSDPWLGLVQPDVYSALENDRIRK